jgi:hypothetical protein
MSQGTSVFSQILSIIDYNDFRRYVRRYDGDRSVRRLSCWEQFLAMAFAQLTRRESLRDIEVSLSAHRGQLYHAGFRSPVKKSTLADANETRDWRIYADFAQHLIQQARPLYSDVDLGLDLDGTLYALDSSIIDLSLTLFPWAPHERTRAAIKLNTLLDVQSAIPVLIDITGARFAGVGSYLSRTRVFHCHGSRLRRFPALISPPPSTGLFCSAGEAQSAIPPASISSN